MKFMMMVKADDNYEAGIPPRPELMAAVGQFTRELIESGALLETGGLLPSSAGARVKVSGGRLLVTDGPFVETKELIGGYAILKAGSKHEAIAHGRRLMKLHAEILGPTYDGEIEIRPLADYRPES